MSIYIVSILDGLMPEEIAKKMLHKHILLYRLNILNIENKKKESAMPRQNRNRIRKLVLPLPIIWMIHIYPTS